jgi:hypothetical protein
MCTNASKSRTKWSFSLHLVLTAFGWEAYYARVVTLNK